MPERSLRPLLLALLGGAVVWAGSPVGLHGQAPLAVEARAGVFAPVGGFRQGPEEGGRLSAGPSLGVAFALERAHGYHLVVGFSQHRLDCTDDGCGGDGEYVATAWDVGARLDLGSGAAVPWLRLGLTLPRVERDRPEPAEDDVTDLGIGGEAGLGVRISVGGRFHVSPGLRFGAADAGLPDGGTLRMRYVVGDVGIVVGF